MDLARRAQAFLYDSRLVVGNDDSRSRIRIKLLVSERNPHEVRIGCAWLYSVEFALLRSPKTGGCNVGRAAPDLRHYMNRTSTIHDLVMNIIRSKISYSWKQ